MDHKTPKEFITELTIKERENAGKKGIVKLRKTIEKCKYEYWRYSSMFESQKKFKLDPNWLHRKGIKQSTYMTQLAIKYKKGLENIKSPFQYSRGYYNEIVTPRHEMQGTSILPYKKWKQWTSGYQKAIKCIRDIEKQGFDEHGGWESFSVFDKHGRGTAINTAIYGISEKENLFVIQVRRYEKQYKNGFGNVLKSYFLIGYNENGNPFAHPISSRIIHNAIKKDPSIDSPVKAAQAWIWGVKQNELKNILRNGDVALIPAKTVPKKNIRIESGMKRIVDSHFIYSKEIRINGDIYAINPTLRHMKGQHPTQKGKGWFKIMVGRRSNYHDFARPTAD